MAIRNKQTGGLLVTSMAVPTRCVQVVQAAEPARANAFDALTLGQKLSVATCSQLQGTDHFGNFGVEDEYSSHECLWKQSDKDMERTNNKLLLQGVSIHLDLTVAQPFGVGGKHCFSLG